METDWCHFFPQILDQILTNTLPGIVEKFECNFSTTTSLHKIISTAVIMNSLKKFFEYGRIILGCGIANVFFEGERADWIKLIDKLESFAMYDINGRLTEYIARCRVVLQNLLETYDGNVNVAWWNTILTTEDHRIGSGSQIQTDGQGWFLHLYGIYDKVDLYDVPALHLSVPVLLINKFTNTKTPLTLHAGSFSLSRYGEYAYRPDFSVCLVSDEYKPDCFGPRGPVAMNKYHQRKAERAIETKQLLRGSVTEYAVARLPEMTTLKTEGVMAEEVEQVAAAFVSVFRAEEEIASQSGEEVKE